MNSFSIEKLGSFFENNGTSQARYVGCGQKHFLLKKVVPPLFLRRPRDLRLQSPIIIIFRDHRYVRNREISIALEKVRACSSFFEVWFLKIVELF